MKIGLPDNPHESNATAGRYYLLYVDDGTITDPDWKLIGGQHSSTLNRKANSVDVSNKMSGSWKVKKAGRKEWSIDLASLALLQNKGLNALDRAFMDGRPVRLKIQYPDLTYRLGQAIITDLKLDNPYNDAAKVTGTLEGSGTLSGLKLDYTISPTSMIISIASATDQNFGIEPSMATVTSVKNGSAVLAVTSDYAYSSGVLTIKGTYFASLSTGIIALAITLNDGTTLVATIKLEV